MFIEPTVLYETTRAAIYMKKIEGLQQPDHMSDPSEDHHEMKDLMAAAIYVMPERIPPFRNLPGSQISSNGIEDDCMGTLKA